MKAVVHDGPRVVGIRTVPDDRLVPVPMPEPRTGRSKLETGLGWYSLGLGLIQMLAPDAHNRLIGINRPGRKSSRRHRATTRAIALQEISAGAGILTSRRPAGWLWARLGGDAVHLGLLVRAIRGRRDAARRRTVLAAGCVVGTGVIDTLAALRSTAVVQESRMHSVAAVTINRPMPRVEAAWEALEIPNPVGVVVFSQAPGGRGTEVRVVYDESDASLLDKLKGEDPKRVVEDRLRRFKSLCEAGIVVRSDALPEGIDAAAQRHQRPAKPPERVA
jgi:uncharacterized membrane protein